MAEWLRQGPAKPCTRVRFPLPPLGAISSAGHAPRKKEALLADQQRCGKWMPRAKQYCARTQADFDRLLELQDYACAMCHEPFVEGQAIFIDLC
jgi:hypothetical protein